MQWCCTIIIVMTMGAVGAVTAQPAGAWADSNAIAANLQVQDQWLGKDKIDHLTASAFLAGAQYYMLRGELEQSHEQSLRMAIAGTLALGIAKEVYDGVSKRGTPSFKDIVADVLGVGLAVMLISP